MVHFHFFTCCNIQNYQKDLVHLTSDLVAATWSNQRSFVDISSPAEEISGANFTRADALTSIEGGQRWTRRLASGVRRHKYSQRTRSFKAASRPGVQRGIPFEGKPTQITAGQKVIMGSAVILSGLRGQAGPQRGRGRCVTGAGTGGLWI